MPDANDFVHTGPSTEACWRAIVLFGRNVASYKFALAESLITTSRPYGELVKLEELALPFAHAICRHLKHSPIQGTSASSQFLDACRRFNRGDVSEDALRSAALRLGFGDVIDAFHVVNGRDVPKRFFIDERNASGGIRLTDEYANLMQSMQASNLPHEIEARWRLVETAWAVGINSKLIEISGDQADPALIAATDSRRTPVTSARHALNGYQKGACFYCHCNISIDPSSCAMADVDHVLPHSLMQRGFGRNLDGVWNLVLACKECNRGPKGKWAFLPDQVFVERLAKRNEYYVSSHHPLRETIIQQTGATPRHRAAFLRDAYAAAAGLLIHTWSPESRLEDTL